MIIFLLVENQRLKVILIIYGILFLSLCMSTDRNLLSLWDQEKPPKCIHRTIRTTGLLRQGVKSDYLCLLYMCLSRCMNWWTDVNTGELHRKNKSLNFHFWIKKKALQQGTRGLNSFKIHVLNLYYLPRNTYSTEPEHRLNPGFTFGFTLGLLRVLSSGPRVSKYSGWVLSVLYMQCCFVIQRKPISINFNQSICLNPQFVNITTTENGFFSRRPTTTQISTLLGASDGTWSRIFNLQLHFARLTELGVHGVNIFLLCIMWNVAKYIYRVNKCMMIISEHI